ncbi:lactonase family protein [Mariniflexile ostreae]|uniref:Lactonase family protein n=1 Tax=Mariniflexile ostreae TaxID=1520892 RepID=A0ABV5FB25_9FLAO
MKLKGITLLLASLSLFNCKSQTTALYVGTYTDGESEGIYRLEFNAATGELSNKTLAARVENPSFISFSPNKKFIYAVGEGSSSAVTAFKLRKDGLLELINQVSSNGKGPCHVAINAAGNKAVVSNYGGGTVSIYTINENGSLNEASQVFDHNIENEKSHVHSAQFDQNNLFVADLGRNALYHYVLEDSIYKIKSTAITEMKGNPGPRHFTMTENKKQIYVINEYANSITALKKTEHGFESFSEYTTLAPSFNGESFCADIHLSQDERFLYGSNRGENSIVVFKRNLENGTLENIQNSSVHGDWPRNFTLDPTGTFMLVANQRSHNISVFKVDQKTGKLSFLNTTHLPSPVCLLF